MSSIETKTFRILRQKTHLSASIVLAIAILVTIFVTAPSPAIGGVNDLTQNDYRWYQNVNAVPPTTSLAAENTAITGVGDSEVLRVRMNVHNSATNLPTGQTFKLQYSTSTSGPWTDVGGLGSSEIWRGFDNPTPSDGAALSTNELGSSSPPAKQTYEEANVATSVGINKNKIAEWDWVVESNSAAASTTYYFRMVLGDGTALAGYTNYPQATTAALDLPRTAPTGLVATAGAGTVSLNWDDNTEPDLAGYNVYRGTTLSGPYSKINGTLVASSTYNDTGVTNGTTYYYVVRAEDNGANESSNSSEVSSAPNATILTQNDYRWYQNLDAVPPTTPWLPRIRPRLGSVLRRFSGYV